jgi:hypothetical protein
MHQGAKKRDFLNISGTDLVIRLKAIKKYGKCK